MSSPFVDVPLPPSRSSVLAVLALPLTLARMLPVYPPMKKHTFDATREADDGNANKEARRILESFFSLDLPF